MRKKFILECEICSSRNYRLDKKADQSERFILKKFCKRCGMQTLHRETK
ncbi:50S ribosomal protein L33 [Aquibacillus sp. 3ASR75-11]|uniref:Large ribosomal subunit protein bL33 n=2 Tax=Terrihalobacillus insolitus TaxID=2950438 RepID=A0A9X3WT64_9BACI|nr:50S ribosomal protein L33 [Terrihalobacillus insolitus]MDC3414658.1 50S ribosomal protein L33 [Terrihalobacillus insolitus]MDC3425502.1 50S ribosomal protein L33 [Terrihalobacillus insolitus]